LGKLLSIIIGLRKQGKASEGIEITNQTLKSEFEFDLEELIESKNEELIDFMVKEKNFNNDNIEKLA
jgi:hypothetical protein